MERKILGVVLLVGGIIAVIFGFAYMNSIQYQAMDAFNNVTGRSSDPTGVVAIAIGAVVSVIGGVLLMVGSAPNAPSVRHKPSFATSRLVAKVKNR